MSLFNEQDFNLHDNESDLEYKWRIYQAKATGLLDNLTWEEIAKRIDNTLRPDMPPVDESVYRKEYKTVLRWYENVFKNSSPESGELSDLLNSIKKERVKLRDERTEANKLIRERARFEQQLEFLSDKIEERGKELYKPYEGIRIDSKDGPDMLLLLSDWHIGQTFAGAFGNYNTDIARDRLGLFISEAIWRGQQSHVKHVYVALLGDLINGANGLAPTVRLENRENMVEQTVIAADLLSEALSALANAFEKVEVVNVAGNHSRMGKKDEVLRDERLDDLVFFIAKKSVAHLPQISFPLMNPDPTIAALKIRSQHVLLLHGDYDYDTPQGVSELSVWLGKTPDLVCLGHLHVPAYKEIGATTIVRNGALVGSGSDYAIKNRLVGSASQTILMLSENGVDAFMPIHLE